MTVLNTNLHVCRNFAGFQQMLYVSEHGKLFFAILLFFLYLLHRLEYVLELISERLEPLYHQELCQYM